MIFTPSPFDARVEQICREWEGTPYRHGRCLKGSGVDCLHFAASVLDELYGTEHGKNLKSLPPDACIHNKAGILAAGRRLFTCYPNMERVDRGSVMSGDLVIFGRDSEINSTQHLAVVGAGRIWHASPPSVHAAGLVAPPKLKLVCVYRSLDKELWSCSL